MDRISNAALRQIILLILITVIGITLIWQLQYFISGLLGAITFYILTRSLFFKLTDTYHWKKALAAIVIIILLIIIFALPVWLVVELLIPQFKYVFAHTGTIVSSAKELLNTTKRYAPQIDITSSQIQTVVQKVASVIPGFLNATAGMVVNFFTALFILYFMFIGGRKMEKELAFFLPMNKANTGSLWKETRNLVVSNALGIPLLIICQGLVTALGYFIFGVHQPLVWGVMTGIASIIPVVGSVIVWLPIGVLQLLSGNVGAGVGLIIYSALVTFFADYAVRLTLMKKIGDVHPLITVFGVVVGVPIFGLMGLIFGPLIIAYFFILIKIYRLEFSRGEKRKRVNDT